MKDRFFNYLVITSKNQIFLKKRTENDIWKMLYEFPLIETSGQESEADIMNSSAWKGILDDANSLKIISISKLYKHILTHQRIYARFFRIEIDKPTVFLLNKYLPVDIRLLQKYAIPKLIDRYLLKNQMLH